MTERLTTLLHQEGHHVAVPSPPMGAILGSGRRLRLRRRRRRIVAGVGAAAVTVAASGIAAVWGTVATDRADDARGLDAAAVDDTYRDRGAFSLGNTVHLPGGATVTLDEAVKSLYFTAVGVVTRTGDTPYSDDPGPSHYALVRSDGTTTDLGLDLGDRIPSTDADQPLLAWAEPVRDAQVWEVVVLDVSTRDEVARVRVPGVFTWGGWEAPPVDLDGDRVYVGLDDDTVAANWRTGKVTTTDLRAPGVPEVAGGRVVSASRDDLRVVDLTSGDELLSVPQDGLTRVTLSPDGRYAEVAEADADKPWLTDLEVVDLSTGESFPLDDGADALAWAPSGRLFGVDPEQGTVTTCTPAGECEQATIDGPADGELRLAGRSYES